MTEGEREDDLYLGLLQDYVQAGCMSGGNKKLDRVGGGLAEWASRVGWSARSSKQREVMAEIADEGSHFCRSELTSRRWLWT